MTARATSFFVAILALTAALSAQPASTQPAATQPTTQSVYGIQPTDRVVVFLLDKTGSMIASMAVAREEIRTAMDSLTPEQSFNVLSFSTDIHGVSLTPLAATPDGKRKAREFLQKTQTAGGLGSLKNVFQAALEQRADAIILITDADFDESDVKPLAAMLSNGKVRLNLEIIQWEKLENPAARDELVRLSKSTKGVQRTVRAN